MPGRGRPAARAYASSPTASSACRGSELGGASNVLGADSLGRGTAEQREGELDLVAQEFKHTQRSCLTIGREPPHEWSADHHRLCAESERLDHVGPASDTS